MLMRGNTQTREFLLPLLVPENGLRTDKLLAHIDLVCMPEYPKVIAIGDVTVTIEPNLQQKKTIIADMVDMLKTVGYERPNIALLSMVEKVAFHMKDTIEAQELVREHCRHPIADCQLVGPIAYDLILSKEACPVEGLRLSLVWGVRRDRRSPVCWPGNLIVKCWQMHAHAQTCGVVHRGQNPCGPHLQK